MADPVVSYPFDPTGQASTNRITGELISVIPPGDRLFHYAMPKFAPFFEEGLVVQLRDLSNNVITLTKGVDFYLSHKFMDASLATMHPIWGSISFLRRDIAGTLIVSYNTLGGIWTIDSATITEILVNTIRNPRITSWEQVVERPVDFPVIDHMWNLDDMVGQKEILEVLQNFYTAYLVSLDPNSQGGGGGVISEHISNFNNPHKTTAAQVGAYSILQMDAKLSEYMLKTGTAVNSEKFANLTMAELMEAVANTKVQSAVRADTVGTAETATLAENAKELEGKTLLEIMQDVALSTVANAVKFDGKTYTEARTDILTGKSADSDKLGGKTLSEIIAQLQQSTGDAATLQGKTLEAIMNDVKTVKVNLAAEADHAVDSDKLGGKSLGEILNEVSSTVPALARNSEHVYGYTFPELVTNILQSQEYGDSMNYRAAIVNVEDATIFDFNDGGTQDPNYLYMRVGMFPIPTTLILDGAVVYDPSVRQVSTAMDLMFYYDNKVHALRVTMAVESGTRKVTMRYSSDTDLGTDLYLGVDNGPGGRYAEDGTRAKNAILYFKFKPEAAPRSYGIWLPLVNDFEMSDPEVNSIYRGTSSFLNAIVWQQPDVAGGSSAEFDAMADHINGLLATPAV